MHQTLLSTKLYFPPARLSLVSRPHLVEHLQNGLHGSLTLVSAPAGYGKTTLMSEWRAGIGRDVPVAWLSLDDDDNDPIRFLTYIIAALSPLKPGFGETTLALLKSSPPLPTQVVLISLINELEEGDRTFSLILDDYHVITNPPIHEAVAYLLDHLPPQMHLVILTRADPPLPLSRLRARNQLVEIRSAELRFTDEEASTFLNQVMGLVLSKDQVRALETRTEGWVAGLQLAALSMQGRDDIQSFILAFTGSHHYIVDYLADEVLNSQPEVVQEFLLRTSVLDRLTAPLCDALTDRSDGQTTLEQLEHTNLFLIPLDNMRCWYRYHPLFAEMLRNRLQQLYPDVLSKLHHKAAEWYEHNIFVPEALRHALAAGEKDYAANLVEQNALSMLLNGELSMLLNWLQSVETQAPSRPWISIYLGWVFFQTGQHEKAAVILDQFEQSNFSTTVPRDLLDMQGHIASIRAHIAAYQWDAPSTIAYAHQALEFLPETNLPIRSFAILVLGSAYLLNGDMENAGHYLAEARRLGRDSGNLHVAVLSTFLLANFLVDQGQLHRAVETYQEALQLATTPTRQLLPVAARAYNGLSRVYYEWNDLEAVKQFTQHCIDLAKEWGNNNALVSAYITLGRVRKAEGDLIGAQTILNEALHLMHDYRLAPGVAESVETFQVWLWLAEGNLAAAARWVEKNGYKIHDAVSPPREAEYHTFARVLLAQNEIYSALTLLNLLLTTAMSAGKTGAVIELLNLQALAYQAKNDVSQALKSLESAISLAQSEDYTRIFLDEGEPMEELLRQARSHGIAPKYLAKLLSEFDTLSVLDAAFPKNQHIVEPLSERELEVLRLVAVGKSNQQIAGALFITRGTVKKHLNNIFGKLGVQSRTQCVVRGHELKLL
jgi:LuxR family maltose regulon positive regulatory protein